MEELAAHKDHDLVPDTGARVAGDYSSDASVDSAWAPDYEKDFSSGNEILARQQRASKAKLWNWNSSCARYLENNIFKSYRDVVDDAYKKMKDIQRFQIFDMGEDKPGVVTCMEGPDSDGDGIVTDGTRVRVLFDTDLQALSNPPPNSEKIQTIYNKVRRFVPEEFQNDFLYDPPNAEDERKAKQIQKDRTAAAAKRKHDRLVAAKTASGSNHTNE
ncbi:hypothetical protein PHMEG_00017983 [Phytophthora megakarya]|uniref:Uncharacterized protein n=1 Tax=Phytophthora megakarya TaxID=4795 RepID=A0A225VV82_9STRA|nr:hypothetical protein PHMEG_00017983 [Phytophthora megakarya]